MGKTLPPFSQLIEQERRRWVPFRQTLSNEDQEAFDRMFACAQQLLQAEVRLGRPWRFEAVLMAVLLEHEKRAGEMIRRLGKVSASKESFQRNREWGY